MPATPQSERPFLTARWTELLILNFAVPTETVAELAPPGTEPDLYDGQSFVSIVGFQFRDTRVRGWAVPGHVHFPEINLRYYVRRVVDGEVRRGVVFVQEIVPRRLVALVANCVYNENYVCRPMRSQPDRKSDALAAGDRLTYGWQSRGPTRRHWNTFAARVAATPQLPLPGSLDEFIVEHYWGYARGRDGRTREYRVTHDPWLVTRADEVVWDCDLVANYRTPLTRFLASPPVSAVIAAGSPVQVYRGRRL